MDQGDHRCCKRDIVDECRSDTGKPENGESKGFRVTADRTDACLGEGVDNACRFKATYDNEETDKEEERIPVHITEYFMRIHTAGKDGKHTACEGDRCRFDTDKIVDDEAENGQSQNGDGFLENGIVRNDGRNTDFPQFFRSHFCFWKFLAVNDFQVDDACSHIKQGDRTGIHGKIIKYEMCRGTDHDIWRIADHRAGTANIGKKDFCDQSGDRGDMDTAAEGNRHGSDEEYSSDGIHERGAEAGNQAEDNQEFFRAAFRNLYGPKRHRLKEA